MPREVGSPCDCACQLVWRQSNQRRGHAQSMWDPVLSTCSLRNGKGGRETSSCVRGG